MSEVNFKSLQSLHESLLQKQQKVSEENQQDFVKEVRAYIEQAKRGGSTIASTRERDQIRANLRYWANYIYSIDKTFPDTELAPSMVASRTFPTTLIAMVGFVVLIISVIAGLEMFTPTRPPDTVTPSIILPTLTSTAFTPMTSGETDTPTPESGGKNVILSSPANGDYITPNIEFKGTFDNLKPGWAIHVLFIKGDKYFPVKENYPIPNQPTGNEWTIKTQLTESPEEMSQAQSYSVVVLVSTKTSTRELLSNASEKGIEINSLPDNIIPFDNTARVVYRDPFKVIREPRLVYCYFNGKSYDLFTRKLDGSDRIKITDTPDIYEEAPSLSQDGTKIAYIYNTYSIHIMDSNRENDQEIINGGSNVVESPQWSPDSLYISYVLGDTSQSPTSYSIYIYNLSTKNIKRISGNLKRLNNYRYYSWIPNSKDIVYNEVNPETGTFGFTLAHVDSSESPSSFIDTKGEEGIEPKISAWEDRYILTYAVIGSSPPYSHDIYAVILDTNKKIPADSPPTKLITLTSRSGGTDYPIFVPDSSTIYYVTPGNIYKVAVRIEKNKITVLPGKIDDGEYYGDIIADTGTISNSLSFDIGYMNTFFSIP